jgi:protein arginine kinase
MENITYKYLGWLNLDNDFRDVFVRTKIRLLRNVADFPFPEQAGDVKKRTFLNKVEWLIKNNGFIKNFNFINFDKVPSFVRHSFWEKGILDYDAKDEGKGILINLNGDLSILINEDSHLKFQKIFPGFEINSSLTSLYNLEESMSEYFEYAFDPRLGYLNSYIDNIGLGIKITFWVHLVGVKQKGEIKNLFKSLKSSKLSIKGVFEEEDYTVGNLYEISLNEGLSSDDQLLSKLKKIVDKIVTKEREARDNLMKEKGIFIEDLAGKSLGLLKYSKILSFKGALELLFNIRLASSLNIFSISLKFIDTLSILIQPVHMQLRYKKGLTAQERDILRANLLREVFKSYKIN